MKINRILLLGIILFIYSCGGDTPSLLSARVSTPVPGQLAVSVDKPYVIGLSNPDAGETSDDILITVTGGTGPYQLTAGTNTGLFTPVPSPSWIPAPTITLDPNSVTVLTRVTFTAADAVGGVASVEVIILPFDVSTGPLGYTIFDSTNIACDGVTVDVIVFGGELGAGYSIISGDLTAATVSPATVATNPGTFTVTSEPCATVPNNPGDNYVIITATDNETVPGPTSIDILFNVTAP